MRNEQSRSSRDEIEVYELWRPTVPGSERDAPCPPQQVQTERYCEPFACPLDPISIDMS